MKKRFKKVYVEITNNCNLNCSFCSEIKKEKKEMTVDEFKIIISKIKKYTDFIYLHIKGEPLLHSKLEDLLSVCDDNNISVNITTNGTLLKQRKEILLKHKSIRQLNVSLHSENKIENYFEDVFNTCDELSKNIFISYRLWTLEDNKLNKELTKIVDKIKEHYKLSTINVDKNKIGNNIFISFNNIFTWPDISLGLNINAKCYGLIDQLGILVDGTIVPCCLDSNGIINLGNVFKDNLEDILCSKKVYEIIEGFKNNKSVCELCKNCNFRNRFVKQK